MTTTNILTTTTGAPHYWIENLGPDPDRAGNEIYRLHVGPVQTGNALGLLDANEGEGEITYQPPEHTAIVLCIEGDGVVEAIGRDVEIADEMENYTNDGDGGDSGNDNGDTGDDPTDNGGDNNGDDSGDSEGDPTDNGGDNNGDDPTNTGGDDNSGDNGGDSGDTGGDDNGDDPTGDPTDDPTDNGGDDNGDDPTDPIEQ